MNTGSSRQARLPRVLSTRDLTVYYLATLIGPGILVVPGIAMQVAGPASLLAWLILAVLAFPVAAVFARVSSEYPSAGGTSHVIARAFGARLGETVGLFMLLLYLVGNPILGLAAARYLAALAGWHEPTLLLPLGFVAMSVGVLVNIAGIRIAARLQLLLVLVLVAGLVAVIGVSAPAAQADRLTPLAPHGWSAVAAALLVCFFSFIGWENVSHVADEVRDPRRSYPRAALITAGVVGALYCALALVVALVVPARTDADTTAVLAALLRYGYGEHAARFGSALALLLIMFNIIAWVSGASRLAYSLSRNGTLPPFVARLSPGKGTPRTALALVWACYALATLGLYVMGGDERGLVPFGSAAALLVYVLTFAACTRLFTARSARTLAAVTLVVSALVLFTDGVSSLMAVLVFAVTAGGVRLCRLIGRPGRLRSVGTGAEDTAGRRNGAETRGS